MFPRFSEPQLNRLSEIVANIGIVVLASVALPAIFEKPDELFMVAGFVVSFFCWSFSLRLLKEE